ncbi:MAG: hypothetical protein ACKOWN_05605 [Microbacteriaceae bacterium]
MQFVRPLAGASLAGVLLLSGCSLFDSPDPTETSAAPEPSATETAPSGPGTFAAPTDCTQISPDAGFDAYLSDSIVLLYGPGARYGEDAIQEPTPEMSAGGISCYFGYDTSTPEVYSVVSVVAITADTRGGIVEQLVQQGMNEGTSADGTPTYSILGDADANVPAIYNEVDDSSWISVISVYGGETFFEQNVAIAGIVRDQVYN